MRKNEASNQNFKITLGGWYQRTTLHLSEIYNLFESGKSHLDLSKETLEKYRQGLNLTSVTREAGYLEFLKALTKDGIEIRYYEDGLYVLETSSKNLKQGQEFLKDYFENHFSPAVSYIFSLGAPTPKILANIKTVHPTVINSTSKNPDQYSIDSKTFGAVYQKISSENIVVYKTPSYIFVVSKPGLETKVADIVEMQVFFREFKDQLEKYLNIHRTLWEEISNIKERKSVKGDEVEILRGKLDSYQKTISLIGNRINQMGTYVRTRSSIAKGMEIEEHLTKLFQFKFEVLSDTLDYIKELWKMTGDYLASAIQNIVEIKNQSTARGIQSLQLITSLGVISGIIGYLSRNELPKITSLGAFYFLIIVAATWLVNYLITKIYTSKKYKIRFGERVSDI
ncbi:MAG: Uncharacterized protein G01um101420_39 [Parcubacteria group bacterium Gr01-1014_20]|nr:MAG: Uncharacterized protein G01um101420_39 [Parcubacteria group bacterium Gr01-1014_20]